MNSSDNDFQVIAGKEVTKENIREAQCLDSMVYSKDLQVIPGECEAWYDINPNLYTMIKDTRKNRIIGYINIIPVKEDCYLRFYSGEFKDTELTTEMILNYEPRNLYSAYFASLVIHPDYNDPRVFLELMNGTLDLFLKLSEEEIYIRRMIADAVSLEGEKACELFGMKEIKESNHNSKIYEVTMLPPQFNLISEKARELKKKYKDRII